MNRNILKSDSTQEARASRPHRSNPLGGTPPLLNLLAAPTLRLGKCVVIMALMVGAIERLDAQTLFGWDVNGVASGTTTLNATTAASNITGGQLSLTGITASGSSSTFGGSNWNLTNTFDETDKYFSFQVTPVAGYEVTYSSLQWDQGVTGTAPDTSRWGYKVGTGSFTLQTPITSSNSSNAVWDFTDFTATDTVEFRFWTYGASSVSGGTSASGGASRIRNLTGDDLVLFGSVSAIVPAGASMFWTADGTSLGGTGTWNATNTNWSANESPVSGVTWDNTKSAVFQGTAGAVTVGSISVAGGLLFGTTGYTLNSGTVTLSGAASENNTITTQPAVTATIASTLAGSNGFTKAGDGTLVLTGSNSYTGGTTISVGTLQLGSGSTSGSITGAVANEGSIVVNRSDALTLAGAISGNGSLTKISSGALTLSGSNSYSGGTTISTGTLQIGHNNALGTGSLKLGVSGTTASITFTSNDSTDRTISNALATFSGSSWNTTFGSAGTGNLTFGNSTSVELGALRTFTVNNSRTSFTNAFTGTSDGITKAGTGSLILTGANTYTGATTINAGTLQIGNGGITGALSTSSAITVNGTLAFNHSDDITQGTHFSTAAIGGAGSLVQNGTGNLTINAANTYSGGTVINAGTLIIGHANAAGSGTITQADATSLLKFDTTGTITNAMSVYNVLASQSATLSGAITVNNANWDIETGDTLTVSGDISGSGGVTKTGGGTLILSGSNSYTGSTVINAGTLNAANANALGSNNTVQVNGGTLLVTADDTINGKQITLNGTSTTVATLSFNSNYNGTVGQLTLNANSIIDLGPANNIALEFADMAMGFYNLSIYNWSGTTKWGTTYGTGTDRIFFGTGNYTASNVKFYSGEVGSDSFVGNGFDMGLPATTWEGGFTGHYILPVPEPETWATAVILLVGGMVWFLKRARHPLKKKAAPVPHCSLNGPK